MKELTIVISLLLVLYSCNSTKHKERLDFQGIKKGQDQYTIITFNIEDEKEYARYRQLSAPIFNQFGGEIVHEFEVLGKANGNFEYGKVNRVLFLRYKIKKGDEKLLSSSAYKQVKPIMMNAVSNFKVFIGPTMKMGYQVNPELYLLKITNYKITNEFERNDLHEIGKELMEYDFHADSISKIQKTNVKHEAQEVGLFYFKKASEQTRLYKNDDLLSKIANYNQSYLSSFTYLNLKAISPIY